jgi:hypothetical protein
VNIHPPIETITKPLKFLPGNRFSSSFLPGLSSSGNRTARKSKRKSRKPTERRHHESGKKAESFFWRLTFGFQAQAQAPSASARPSVLSGANVHSNVIDIELPKPLQRPPPLNAPPNERALFRQRRKARRRWFLLAETLSLAVMIGSVLAGVTERFAAESLTPIFRVLPIAAAIVAGILPIVFFGSLNRHRRLG